MKADRPTSDSAERTDARPDLQGQGHAPLPDNREVGPQQTYDELEQAVREDRAKNPRRVLARPSEGTDVDEDESRPTDKWSDPETTSKRIDELRSEGHGPQRHLEVSERNLQDRLGAAAHDANGEPDISQRTGHVKKQRGSQIDPVTGTTTDVETGKPHYCGPYATGSTIRPTMPARTRSCARGPRALGISIRGNPSLFCFRRETPISGSPASIRMPHSRRMRTVRHDSRRSTSPMAASLLDTLRTMTEASVLRRCSQIPTTARTREDNDHGQGSAVLSQRRAFL